MTAGYWHKPIGRDIISTGKRQIKFVILEEQSMMRIKGYRRLRGALITAGLTQEDLADVLRVSPASISNRFRGQQDWHISEMYATLNFLKIEAPETVLGLYFPPDGLDANDQ